MIKKRSLTVFMLAMINIAAICNIANLPFTAQYGFTSLFYYLFSAIIFFIPVGLVSAELATGWPERGGVYIWVREALGEKAGFVAIWLQWIENVIWYPTILSFAAVTFAYSFNPSLAKNKFYILSAILIIYWAMTLINFLGMKISGWISTFCVIIGTIIPIVLIITLGGVWLGIGHPSQINFSLNSFIPDFSSPQQLSVLTAVLLAFGGLEMSAVHAKEVQNPQKNYPKAILFSTIVIILLLSLGSLSISIVIPSQQIELASGPIEAFRYFFNSFKMNWALPIISLLMTFGSLGIISTWIVGPSKGLMVTARHGELPPILQKMNEKAMPVAMLTFQAIIVTVFSMVFLLMPSISSSYRLLAFSTSQLYLIMYIMMFISGIVLRYKSPKVKRKFRLPYKNVGMWVAGIVGVLGSLFAIIMGFFPPPELKDKNVVFYEIFLFGAIIVFTIIPIIIHQIRKPSWHQYKNE